MKEKPVICLFDMLQHILVGILVHILSNDVYHSNNCWGTLACQRPLAAGQYRFLVSWQVVKVFSSSSLRNMLLQQVNAAGV